MKPSQIKDQILKMLVNNELKNPGNHQIAKHINQNPSTIYVLLKEMHEAEHIEVLNTSTPDHYHTCMVRTVYPKGEFFYNTTSYRKQAIKKWWIDAPKNYWMIGTVFALLTSNIALIRGLLSNESDRKAGIEQTPSQLNKKDTTIKN
jgi:hypothetical protein